MSKASRSVIALPCPLQFPEEPNLMEFYEIHDMHVKK